MGDRNIALLKELADVSEFMRSIAIAPLWRLHFE